MTVYIAAPFGNYLKTSKTRSVIGSFTLERRKGLIKQELVSYEIDELTNMVVKKIHTRKYAEDGVDYIDTWNSEPLCEAKNEETNLNEDG